MGIEHGDEGAAGPVQEAGDFIARQVQLSGYYVFAHSETIVQPVDRLVRLGQPRDRGRHDFSVALLPRGVYVSPRAVRMDGSAAGVEGWQQVVEFIAGRTNGGDG